MADPAVELDDYLKGKGSPLAGLGSTFVAAGRKYGVDPRLTVAISGAESSFGKYPYGSNNPFGWGPGIPFGSWEEAISVVTKGLKTGYLDEGLRTPAQIRAKWAPEGAANDPTGLNSYWVKNVSEVLKELGASPGKMAAASSIPDVREVESPITATAPDIPSAVAEELRSGGGSSSSALRRLTFALASAPPASAPAATVPPPTGVATPGAAVSAPVADVGKWAALASGADREGVATNPKVLATVAGIAQMFGSPLVVGTGTNHNQYVKGSSPPRQSAHWLGSAADIPASGAELTRLGRAALMFAGMTPAQAAQQKGGVFNLGGLQILFNTMEGGNHYNHLHVGLK